MKISKYTSVITIDEKHTIVFGASTSQFLVIKNLLVRDREELNKLIFVDSKLREQLIHAGILIDDNIDEVSELKYRIGEVDNDDSEFQLHINPTLDCNFRCWYCYENHTSGSTMSSNIIERINRYVQYTISRLKNLKVFHLAFFGGEPLLRFEEVVKPLMERTKILCKDRDVALTIQFTSNGYLLNEDMITYLSNYNTSFQITLDGNRTHHDNTRFAKGGIGSFEKIISNVRSLVEHKIFVTVRINYTTENVRSVREIIAYFENIPAEYRNYFSFDFHRVWQQVERKGDETEDIISDIKMFFRENGFLVSSFVHRDIKFSCYGDKKNYALINYNGEVFGCTARDFISKNRIGVLKDDGIIEYDQPVYERRCNAKFIKQVCYNCRIAPICGGGCRQKAYESINSDRCTYCYDNEDIDKKVLEIFYHSFC